MHRAPGGAVAARHCIRARRATRSRRCCRRALDRHFRFIVAAGETPRASRRRIHTAGPRSCTACAGRVRRDRGLALGHRIGQSCRPAVRRHHEYISRRGADERRPRHRVARRAHRRVDRKLCSPVQRLRTLSRCLTAKGAKAAKLLVANPKKLSGGLGALCGAAIETALGLQTAPQGIDFPQCLLPQPAARVVQVAADLELALNPRQGSAPAALAIARVEYPALEASPISAASITWARKRPDG